MTWCLLVSFGPVVLYCVFVARSADDLLTTYFTGKLEDKLHANKNLLARFRGKANVERTLLKGLTEELTGILI